MIEQDGAISPENTLFVMLCFEGPDVYSTAGGLGTRVTELSEALEAGCAPGTSVISPVHPTKVWFHGDAAEAKYEKESKRADVPRRDFSSC